MKTIPSLSVCFLCALSVSAQETVSESTWEKQSSKPDSPLTALASEDGRACLDIKSVNSSRAEIHLWSITNPAVTSRFYAMTGEVKYDMKDGDGYLEMWSWFGSNRYFSKTLGETGPMGKITGKSGWRKFVVPFDRNGAPSPPTHLDINLILNGQGEVLIGPLKLAQYPKATSVQEILFSDASVPGGPAILRPAAVTIDGRSCLKVDNSGGLPVQVALATLTNVAVTSRFYSVSGEVKYDGVEGDGYLEMWSVFPSGRYFSRGLEPAGPMGKISRSSGWRPFLLPFDRNGIGEAPTQLEINLILPGRGTVYIGPIKFSENPEWDKYGNARGTADVVRRELYSYGWWTLFTAWKVIRTSVV